MKRGLSMEQHAKINHKKLKISVTGLVTHEELPYIAASPDLEVEC